MRFFPRERNFRSLSIRDLLDAREAYHVHLSNLANVVGTAVGLYRIREKDSDAKSPGKPSAYGAVQEARTLENTRVVPWSWPCVLVFTDRWWTLEQLRKHPDLGIPRRLYLPDGRVVPTCVVVAPKGTPTVRSIDQLSFSSQTLGGGYPVFTDHQGAQQVGSVGCLVTNGESTFALTNRHVTGKPGTVLRTLLHGHGERIGVSDERQLGKIPFEKAYPGWPGSRAFVNVDAGLIHVDDIHAWTSQVFGIGEIGELVDLHPDTVSLDLVGCPVRAFGAASGVLEGEIHALFYRYRSVGGVDFVADVLIGPRAGGAVRTRPGDSGTVWFVDPPSGRRRDPAAKKAVRKSAKKAVAAKSVVAAKRARQAQPALEAVDSAEPAAEVGRSDRTGTEDGIWIEPERGLRARRLRPLAIQWGGERLVSGSDDAPIQFALATFLSTVCRELDVDLVRQWNAGHSEYWGKIGHFKIGAKACDLVATDNLRTLMQNNRLNIGFDDDDLSLGREFRVGRDQFVPLADVPDYVWISASHTRNPGGREHEGPQHFADMDQKGRGKYKNKTLLDLCKDPKNVDPAVWKDFYDAFPDDERPEEGTLPFRVEQLYDEMVAALKNEDVARFVATAGVLAHYVGDACQPLHVSHLHHGRGPEGGKKSPEWADYKKSPEYKIHAIYEQGMFEVRAVEMLDAINTALVDAKLPKRVKGGRAAAIAVVDLMRQSHKALPPEEIIDADDPTQSAPERGRTLWDAVGVKTAERVAAGCRVLAGLWESAWAEGKGNALGGGAVLGAVEESELSALVRNKGFLPARGLG